MLSRCTSAVLRRSSGAILTPCRKVGGARFFSTMQRSGMFAGSSKIRTISVTDNSVRHFSSLPRSVQNLELPALSPTMEAGSVAKWHKKVGDRIIPGDLICDIETDKAVVGFEAQEECYLAAILVQAGAGNMDVGTPLGITVDEESDLPAAIAAIAGGARVGGAAPAVSTPASVPAPTPVASAAPAASIPKPVGAEKLELPALSPTMEAGSVAKWHKKVGDHIIPGDLVCDIETDKAVVGFEAQEESYLACILVQEGAGTLPVGAILGYTCESADQIEATAKFASQSSAAASSSAAPTQAAPAPSAPAAAASTSTQASQSSGQFKHVLTFPPSVSHLIHNLNLDASSIKPTGPKGRLIKDDIILALQNGTAVKLPKSTTDVAASKPSAKTPSQAPKQATVAPAAPGLTKRQLARRSYVEIPVAASASSLFTEMASAKTTVPHTSFSIDVPTKNAAEFCSAANISIDAVVIRAASKAFNILPVSTGDYVNVALLSTETKKGNNGVELSYPSAQIIKKANVTAIGTLQQKINEIPSLEVAQPKLDGSNLLITLLSSEAHQISFGLDVLPTGISASITTGSHKTKTIVQEDDSLETVEYITIAGVFDGSLIQLDEAGAYMEKLASYVSNPTSMIL